MQVNKEMAWGVLKALSVVSRLEKQQINAAQLKFLNSLDIKSVLLVFNPAGRDAVKLQHGKCRIRCS